MSIVPKRLLTAEDYLAKERAAEFKSQFYHGEMFAMAGASKEHNRINANLVRTVGNALVGGECETYSRDMRLKISPTGLYTYPDIVIVCGVAEFEDGTNDTLLNPRVVFEILSDSTELFDRGRKFDHYQTLDSVKEYILVAQNRPRIERFVRQNSDWVLTKFEGLDSDFTLTSVNVRIPMKDIFRAVDFEDGLGASEGSPKL